MHVGKIILSKFQGKYEKIRIMYIYMYNFKIVLKKKIIKDNLKKKKLN